MRHPLNFSFGFLLAFAAPSLPAQIPLTAWSGVLQRPLDLILVQARVVTMEGAQYLQFRNEGKDAVNFSYSVNGEDPFLNPRVHVKAHKRSAYLPLPEGVTGGNLKFFMLRLGADQGPVLDAPAH